MMRGPIHPMDKLLSYDPVELRAHRANARARLDAARENLVVALEVPDLTWQGVARMALRDALAVAAEWTIT